MITGDRFARGQAFLVHGDNVVSKLVILSIGEGDFEQGFSVTIQIGAEGVHPAIAQTGKLPAAPEMPLYYSRWQSSYKGLGLRSRISARQVTPRSLKEDCHNAAQILRVRFNTWLRSEEFRPIQDTWRETLTPTDTIRVLLQTTNTDLQRLPWHLWDVLERYTKAEIGLSSPVFKPRSQSPSTRTNVHILAISGDSEGIDTETDRALLQQLPNAEITFLAEPNRRELTDHLRQKPWDILFFAGHSDSREDGHGRIYLNRTDSLTIAELKFALSKSVESGLKLAMFNSCDGLGLARDLADLQIPHTIFMREPVPDRIAQEFLKYFLTAYSQGESLYLSLRTGRECLEALEDEFLYATWLPVLYQHPGEIPPTWHSLIGTIPDSIPHPHPDRSIRSLSSALLIGVAATAAVMGVRYLGLLQDWELKTYDQMLQLRSTVQPEDPDNRILVVEITDQDIDAQKERKEELGDTSLSNKSLVKLLRVLNKYQPRAIGLDLYRDAKGVPTDVVQVLNQTPNLIGICKSPSSKFDPNGIAPPQGIPTARVGFSDAPEDPDGIARRQLMEVVQDKDSVCSAKYSLSMKLALQYLEADGIRPTITSDGYLQLGKTVLKPLNPRFGSYQKVSDLNIGRQILLNYRPINSSSVSLSEVLNDQKPLAIKDRIVLIGVSHQKSSDKWVTPYSKDSNVHLVPGVLLQAQEASQIISAVLDQRPLLWVWDVWIEILWIAGWAGLGGLLIWRSQSPMYQVLGIVAATTMLVVICVGVLTQSGWIPCVPAGLALVLTGGSMMVYQAHHHHRKTVY